MLENLFDEYKKNVEKFIELAKGKLTVFDFDGTLSQFQYTLNRMLPCLDKDVEQYTLAGYNMYENVHLLKTMQYIFSKIEHENIWILTQTVSALEKIKTDIVVQNFKIPSDKVIHVKSSVQKLDILKTMHEKYQTPIVFIEDNAQILIRAEDELEGVKAYHISCLLP